MPLGDRRGFLLLVASLLCVVVVPTQSPAIPHASSVVSAGLSSRYLTGYDPVAGGNVLFPAPQVVAFDTQGRLYCTSDAGFSGQFQRLDPRNPSEPALALNGWYYGAAADSSGNIYVTDVSMNLLKKYSSTGVLAWQWSGLVAGKQFAGIRGVAVNPANGRVYVADSANSRVVFCDASRRYPGALRTTFNCPTGIACDSSGNTYVSNLRANSVTKINRSNNYVTTFGSGAGLRDPEGVCVDRFGDLFVADQGNNRVMVRWAQTGAWGSVSLAESWIALNAPSGVAVDAYGHLWIADTGNNRIVQLAPNTVALSPPTAPAGAVVDRALSAQGFVQPYHAPSGQAVVVDAYRYSGRTWILGLSGVPATTTTGGTYVARLTFPQRGTWRLRARHVADDGHAETASSYSAGFPVRGLSVTLVPPEFEGSLSRSYGSAAPFHVYVRASESHPPRLVTLQWRQFGSHNGRTVQVAQGSLPARTLVSMGAGIYRYRGSLPLRRRSGYGATVFQIRASFLGDAYHEPRDTVWLNMGRHHVQAR